MTDVSIPKISDSEIPTLFCTEVYVRPKWTDMKWDPSKKHPEIRILGMTDTAKTTSSKGEYGIIAKDGMIIGTTERNWLFNTRTTGTVYVGLADEDKDLTTSEDAQVSQLINVVEGDNVIFCLTNTSILTIKHQTGDGKMRKTYIRDLTEFYSTTLYPWVSSYTGTRMAVRIMEDFHFNIVVDPDGKVRMNGFTNDIVDFGYDDIISNNPGSGGGGGSSISNGGSSVTVGADGNIVMDGGITYKSDNITTPVTNITLQPDQHIVIVSNPITTSVTLPAASGGNKEYIIIRNYSDQIGETWQLPVLSVVPVGLDTVEFEPFLGIPTGSSIQLISDGINTWRTI